MDTECPQPVLDALAPRHGTRRPVKPTRNTARRPAPFGAGILPDRPHAAAPFTARDAAWAAQSFGNDTPDDETFDAMAAESEALDRLTNGHLF